MVKLADEDIIDSHKGEIAVVCVHGPSLGEHLGPIIKYQKLNKIVRFDPNDWFAKIGKQVPPDYWVLASNIDTVSHYADVMNSTKCKILFADSVDMTPYDWIEKNLETDYYGYDQRHFKNDSCRDILRNFKDHHTKNKNFDFTRYGNNSVMWQPPFGGTPGGVDIKGKCCHRIVKDRKTIQEMLQEYSGHSEHYSSGATIALHMIAFTILMGFREIYIAGLDLDYSLGYVNRSMKTPEDFWKNSPETRNLVNDLRVLNESANKKNTKIINLNPDVWYGVFEQADCMPNLISEEEERKSFL